MSVKSFRYLMSAMLLGGVTLFAAAQQPSSTHELSPAVFHPGASTTNHSEMVKDQRRLAELERCKLASCKAEAADLRLQMSRLNAAQPHLLRTQGCTPNYVCGGSPGYYIYGNIQDTCATEVTSQICPNGRSCSSNSGTTTAQIEGPAPGSGVCNFSWTVNGYTSYADNVPMQ